MRYNYPYFGNYTEAPFVKSEVSAPRNINCKSDKHGSDNDL